MRFSNSRFILPLVAAVTVPTTTYSAGVGIKSKPSAAAKPGLSSVSARLQAVSNLSLPGWNYALESDALEKAWSWKTNLDTSGPFETRVAFHYKNPQDYIVLRVKGDAARAEVGFWRVANGKAERLGEPVATIGAPHGQLTVQRSAWRVRALWNGKAIVTAFSDVAGERFGVATHGAAKLSTVRMQPVEAPVFSDDFMRAQGPDATEAPGDWHRVAGIWKTSGLIGPRADAALNPNPFVFRAEVPSGGDGSAVATVGKWFWSDYTVTASVRPTLKDPAHPLVAGLAAYHQADGSSVVGMVDFKTGLAVLRSGNRTLATGAPFRVAPDQWHRIFLEPGPGTVRLVVDGVERVRASTPAGANLAQGEATLTAELGGSNYADFDDVRVGPNDAISDDFRTAAVGRWDNVQGDWQTQPGQGQNAGRRVKISAGTALTLTGNPEREEGLVEATFADIGPKTRVRGNPEPVGVVFAARDANNYFVARKRTGAPLEIVEVANGTGKVLANAQHDKGTATSINPLNSTITVEWREGVITAHGGNTTATATVAAIPEGRVGAWAGGAGQAIALTA
ncbi:MAG: hypothetical protein JOZ57_02315, partial [Abitibacteriaceae bacterium]|nr:hypothetical protein [Abditibacteriaceae bacterium]